MNLFDMNPAYLQHHFAHYLTPNSGSFLNELDIQIDRIGVMDLYGDHTYKRDRNRLFYMGISVMSTDPLSLLSEMKIVPLNSSSI